MTSEKLHNSRSSLFPAICVGPLLNRRRKLSSIWTEKASSVAIPSKLVEVDSSNDHLIDGRLKSPTRTMQAVSGFC